MMATGVYAGEAFNRWVGEEHTDNTIANLNAIDAGITVLQEDLLAKQAELDTANANLKTDKETIASLEKRLKSSLELEELKTLVSNTNNKSGLRHKYDSLKDGINKHLDAQEGVDATDKLNEHNGKEAEDNQLNEALKDVQDLEKKSGEVLESLNLPIEPEPDPD